MLENAVIAAIQAFQEKQCAKNVRVSTSNHIGHELR